jgi:hypothetical protein
VHIVDGSCLLHPPKLLNYEQENVLYAVCRSSCPLTSSPQSSIALGFFFFSELISETSSRNGPPASQGQRQRGLISIEQAHMGRRRKNKQPASFLPRPDQSVLISSGSANSFTPASARSGREGSRTVSAIRRARRGRARRCGSGLASPGKCCRASWAESRVGERERLAETWRRQDPSTCVCLATDTPVVTH